MATSYVQISEFWNLDEYLQLLAKNSMNKMVSHHNEVMRSVCGICIFQNPPNIHKKNYGYAYSCTEIGK
jgi:hypothetical protein